MAESGRWVSNIKISILLKKGWFSYVRDEKKNILETRRKTHLHCSPHFTIPLNLIFDLNLRQWNLPQLLIDQVWFSLFFVWDYQWKTGRYFFRTLSLTENIVYPIPQLRNSLWRAIHSVQKTLSKQKQM